MQFIVYSDSSESIFIHNNPADEKDALQKLFMKPDPEEAEAFFETDSMFMQPDMVFIGDRDATQYDRTILNTFDDNFLLVEVTNRMSFS